MKGTKATEDLSDITNDLLAHVREMEYTICHFMKKTNRSTALEVRTVLRDINKFQKKYKDSSIAYFEKEA